MKFLETSVLRAFTLFGCVVALTTAAVICIDESSLNNTQSGNVNELQRKAGDGTEVDAAVLNLTDFSNSSTNGTNHGQSQVTQFLQTVQDTLEKAKPWVVELEKEAKRLEETAKRFGEGVIRGLGSFVDRLIGVGNGSGGPKPTRHEQSSTTNPLHTSTADDKTPDLPTTTAKAVVAEVVSETLAAVSAVDDAENEISEHDNALCPDGFVADVNGICLRNHN
uniref:Apolipophorin-3 n=1 Tax=Bactrocera dorsalis TaxID=27457 RepID=A0A034WCT1_BACDO